ncbi:MAG TPA: carboxypeptidase-like regulatory domain-containing protein, partial [Planctomycetota bacterium]|nr:carboxypeptidase-like regulatory domain-containing protein [Planctomycetota bacterium]
YAWAAFRAETGSLADGSFELGGLGDGPYTLLVTAPSRGTAKLVGIRPGVDPLVIALHPAGSISGTVTDGAGHPIPGISIALARRTSSADLEESGDGRSGLDGRFAFTDVASGGSALVLQASGEGFATRRLTLPPLTTGGAREVEVVLEPSSELAIRVVGSRGEPLAGAAVEAHGIADSAFVGSATTGAGGIATIPGASATRLYRVYAEAPGHVVGIAPGASTESIVELRLDPAYALAGRVVDAGGAGAAARVRLIRSSDRDVTLEQLDATADASGGFRFDGLAAGDVRLVAEAPGFAPAQVGPLHVGPGADGAFAGDVVIALDAGVAWIGRVRTEDGDAIADAVVSLVTKAPASARASDVLGVATRTARDGAFRLEHVPSRATALLVSAPDLAPRLLRIPDASASPAGVRDLGDLRLARGGGVVGRVVDAAGRPLAGIRIGLSSRESFGAAAPRTETGADGEFAIRGVAPGAYSLDAVDPAGTGLESGFERITVGVDVESGADSVVIVDGREHGRVTGRVRIGGAPPRFETEVALAIPDGSGRELAASHVGWDGSFSLPAPIAGTLAIEVRSLEGTAIRASRLVTLRERESRHVAIDVGGAAVEGRVRAKSDGAPLAGARVELVTAQGGRCCVAADGEGRFAIEGLPDGVASLTVEAPGHARARVRGIALSERARATCDVALEAEAAIVVRAVGPDGEPLAGAHVSILNRDGDLVAEGVADRSGEVAANALRAAEYGVVVEHESCLPRSIHLALTAGRVTRQDVELEKP